MTFQKNFVEAKMILIDGYLGEAKELFRLPDKEMLADSGRLHIAERLLQLLVDTIIDINEYFIKELNLLAAEDYHSTFKILADGGILPMDFAQKIAPVVGLRNKIVHRYEEVDKQLFLKSFRENIDDFRAYLNFINKYLDKLT